MTLPYRHRIVAIIGQDRFEVERFRRRPTLHDIQFVTRDLSCEWVVERTMLDDHTITARWKPEVGGFARKYSPGKHKVIKYKAPVSC